jgi:hypothetical protein
MAVNAASTPRLEITGLEYLRFAFMLPPYAPGLKASLAGATVEKAIPGSKALPDQHFLACRDCVIPATCRACLSPAGSGGFRRMAPTLDSA